MKTNLKGLDPETQILISLGAAVACGCQPCLEKIVAQARTAGINEAKLKNAAIIGQFVKDQPAAHMKQLADRLLGTHLSAGQQGAGCPMDPAEASARPDKPAAAPAGCGCSG
ncbi:MAG: carboxymuconolactone decarboxylase family protein [Desulfobacterales bacterium]|nr:carboxymuconolactone decarboxylase family protein [Desulfobacterales bacterium]